MNAAVAVADDQALTGLALQAVSTILPAQAEIIVRLSADARREVVAKHIDYLMARNVLTSTEAAGLHDLLSGASAATGTQHTADEVVMGSAPPALTIAEVIHTAVASSAPSVEFESFLDVLWDAAVTVVGALIGDAIGGPVGAGAAALAAHEWAQAHPPSTWEF
jgi:hypothetical protein